jgi:hypothetical protein
MFLCNAILFSSVDPPWTSTSHNNTTGNKENSYDELLKNLNGNISILYADFGYTFNEKDRVSFQYIYNPLI